MDRDQTLRSDPSRWRLELLDNLLTWALVLGALAMAVSIPALVAEGAIAVIAVDVGVLGVVAMLSLARSLPYRFRAVSFLMVVGALGFVLSFAAGWSGLLFLLSVPILATVLLGRTTTIVVTGAVTVSFGIVVGTSERFADRFMAEGLVGWAAAVGNFFLVSVLLTFAAGSLIGRLERALRSESRAAAEAARLAAAVEQASESVLLCDADGVVVYENPAHRRLVGRIGASASISSIGELIEQVAVWRDRSRPGVLAATGTDPGPDAWWAWSGVVVLHDREGVEHRFDARCSPLRDRADGGRPGAVSGAAVSLQDVSERCRMEEQLRRSERLESLGTFASGVAHDFNNVMAGVRLLAETIVDQSDAPEIADPARAIVGACDRVGVTVQQMLLFGRHGTPERRPIVLADAVEDALVLVRAALPPGIDLVAELADRSVVEANPAEIQQVVMNLATNAVHAMTGSPMTRANGPTAGSTRAVSGSSSGHPPYPPRGVLAFELRRVVLPDAAAAVELVATDTGVGIDPADLQRLFDPFFTTKPPGEGSGMGLASVHGIVAGPGGTIAVASEPGRGAEFRIRLPAATSPDAASTAPDRTPDRMDVSPNGAPGDAGSGVAAPSRLHILLVDDESSIRTAAATYLRRCGHTVTTAGDGLDALEQFDGSPDSIDLVITDISMPRLDGPALVDRLRTRRPELPVLLSSGYGETNVRTRAADEVPLLAKPYSFRDLVAAISQVMANSKVG